MVMQHELGTKKEGHHIQGFLTSATRKRHTTLGNQFKVQPEAFQAMMKNSTPQKNRAYCTDDSKRKGGTDFFEYGTVPGVQQSKGQAFCDLIKKEGLKQAIESDPWTFVRNCGGYKTLDMHYKQQQQRPEALHVICIHGPPGSGKSWWAKKLYDPGHTYTLPAVPRSGQAWFDYYDNQRTLLIDEFSGRIEYELFKNMLDPLEMLCPTKGDHSMAMWDTVIITTNFHPSTWYNNDIDAWGTETVSPIQRRIHSYIEAEGNYNAGTQSYKVHSWINNISSDAIQILPTRTDEDQPQETDTPTVEQYELPKDPTRSSNPSETAFPTTTEHDEFIESLHQDWEDQDNDFLRGIDLLPQGPDPDNLLMGTEATPEPQGFNIPGQLPFSYAGHPLDRE